MTRTVPVNDIACSIGPALTRHIIALPVEPVSLSRLDRNSVPEASA
jgi:hypothetical protein